MGEDYNLLLFIKMFISGQFQKKVQDDSSVWMNDYRYSLRLMKILAIDTSTEACSAALSVDDQVISRYELAPRKHTQLILPMIDDLMKEADLAVTQLDGLAFGRGPGAFTGVRIATGVIQGISFGADLPVAPVSSLAALAQGCWREHKAKKVISAIDARMKEVYWGHYQLENGLMVASMEEGICTADQVPSPEGDHWNGAGSGWEAYADQLSRHFAGKISAAHPQSYPHAIDIIELAKPIFDQGNAVSAEQVSPVYLRDNVVG